MQTELISGEPHGAINGDSICRVPGDCASCSLRPIALCGQDAEERVEEVTALRQPHRQVAARRVIFHEGDRLKEIYQLYDGWAFRYKVLKDGRRQILSVLLPGDCVNMPVMFADHINYSVKTLTPVSFCVFNASQFFHFISASPLTTKRAGLYCANVQAQAEELILDLGCRSAYDRVGRLIAGIVSRLRVRGVVGPIFPLPLTQLHIADATGLTPVHIGRILGEMRHAKLLDVKRGYLTLHDPDWLLRVAR